MKNFFIVIFVFAISFSALGKAGGATSGGGDILGIDAAKIAEHVFSSIDTVGTMIYSSEDLEVIHEIKNELKIIMTDEELPVSINGVIQNGSAFSIRENKSSTMFINKNKWNNITTLLEREVLIHHEIMVLAGLEYTGDYHLSLEFEKLRKNFWKLSSKNNVICSINIYEKSTYYLTVVPGKLVGSSSSSINFSGVKSDMGILSVIKNDKAIIFRGVISTSGYFRMEINEVEFYKSSLFGKKLDKTNVDNLDLSTLRVIEEEKTYFDPYQIIKPVANPIVFGENYAIVVNCNAY